ncbi:MAG: hypothetical protein UT66_C0046G0007, partial [candidate division CPR2 bacterium GW2011_GWC1_39_9]
MTNGYLGGSNPYKGLRTGNPANPDKYKWLQLKWSGGNITGAYKVWVQARTADSWHADGDEAGYMPIDINSTDINTWTQLSSNSGVLNIFNTNLISSQTKTLEIRLKLEGDGAATPVLSDLNIEYILSDSIILDSTPPAVASDTVTSPNGAETWLGGSNHNITWNTAGISDANLLASPIKLEYTTNNGSSWAVIGNSDVTPLSNSGTYAWNPIPSADSTQVKVKI